MSDAPRGAGVSPGAGVPPADDALIAFLRRSYHAVDGLWFVKVEAEHDFEDALQLDQSVWEVMAKIQAREARRSLGCEGNGPDDLARCFALKLTAEGHRFECEVTPAEVRFVISGCPWEDLLRKSGREGLAERVAVAICPTEGTVWCGEFGGEYAFGLPDMRCCGAERCEMRFERIGT